VRLATSSTHSIRALLRVGTVVLLTGGFNSRFERVKHCFAPNLCHVEAVRAA
jgi:hypothetical protein